MKKIIITGGTGYIGKNFIAKYYDKYHFYILTRNLNPNTKLLTFSDEITYLNYNIDNTASLIDENTIILNLAGENIASKKWSLSQKSKILNSRIETTEFLVTAINSAKDKPSMFLSGSAIGYYGNRCEEKLDENSSAGHGFLASVCGEWEKTALQASIDNITLLRTGIVVSKESEVIKKLLLTRPLIPSKLGKGNQWMSWININDYIDAIDFIIKNNITGAVNLTNPIPFLNLDFIDKLSKEIKLIKFFPIPEFALKLILSESASTALDSQFVIPKKLIDNNFNFNYPNIL